MPAPASAGRVFEETKGFAVTTEYKCQILKRNVDELIELICQNYWSERDLHIAAKIDSQYTRLEELNGAVYAAIEEWIERPCEIEYTADLRFLLLVYAYRRYQTLTAEKKRLYQLENEFYGQVIAELLDIKARYERSNDETSEDYRTIVRDNNEDEVSERLLDLTFACLKANDWKPFDDWRKSDLYSIAVVTVG